ncbi:MAG: hypothetical protein L0323_05120 [Planctomycetes bacterium]|nr:hypothetical protein [Planctomycetota bacterium]
MHLSRRLLPAAGTLALLAGGARSSEIEVEAPLVLPFPAPDPDAFGQVRLEKHGAEQKFRVRGENLATQGPLAPFDVWLESGVGTGSFFLLGSMILESSGNGRWELELEAEGAAPPALGVADLADVAGRAVQVRAAGGSEVYLTGIVPNLGAGGGGGAAGPVSKAQVSLQRPVPAPDPDAFGKVELEKQGTEQEFKVDGRNLPVGPADGFGVLVEEGVGTGTFLTVGAMALKSTTQGRWELDLENHGAAPPQLGVPDLADLAGRRVEVRGASGDLHLWAVLPAISTSPGAGSVSEKAGLAPPTVAPPSPAAKGTVAVKLKASQGTSCFDLKVQKGLAPNLAYVVWIEDAPGSGTFAAAGELQMSASGTKGRLRRDTKKGDSLPLGVGSVLALSGRAVEVRDGASAVHLVGTIP